MRSKANYFTVLLSLLALAAIVLAIFHISQPGLYYDEMLFGNAATGGKSDIFIRKRIWGIPVLLMNYIGALKSWIYYPIFSVLSVNYWTIRLPAAILGIAGGVWLVLALREGFGRPAALAGAVLILFDPTLITQSRLDWGPNALMFFFRGIMLFALVKWIKTKEIRWAWITLIALTLGLFDKLSFIWIAAAAGASICLFYFEDLRSLVRSSPWSASILTGLSVLIIGGALFRSIRITEHQDTSWPERFQYAAGLLRYTFCGGGALDFISGNGLRLEKWTLPGYLLIISIAVTGAGKMFKNAERRRLYCWIVTFMTLLAAFFILTRSATGPHHASVLSGIWQCAVAPLAGAVWEDHSQGFRKILRYLVPLSLLLVLAGNIHANLICTDAFAHPVNANWDPANTEAAQFVLEHPDGAYICSDWGIGTQLITLTKGLVRIQDAWPFFINKEEAVAQIKDIPGGKDVFVFTRLPPFENFRGNRDNLIYALETNHLRYEVVRTWAGQQGAPMIELWKLVPVL